MSLGKKVLNTKRWGKLEIDLDEEISFERGIPGFEENKQFVLLDSDDIKPFYWLVNIEGCSFTSKIISSGRAILSA